MSDLKLPYQAAHFARAWRAVWQCTSSDETRSATHQTMHIEQHDGGIALSATDSYVVASAWCPFTDGTTDPPRVEEVPAVDLLVADYDGVVDDLMRRVIKAAKQADKDETDPPTLDAHVRKTRPGSQLRLFDVGERELAFTLNAGDLVTALPISGAGGFPKWRQIDRGEPTGSPFAQSPHTVALVARTVAVFTAGDPDARVDVTAGSTGIVTVQVDGLRGEPSLTMTVAGLRP